MPPDLLSAQHTIRHREPARSFTRLLRDPAHPGRAGSGKIRSEPEKILLLFTRMEQSGKYHTSLSFEKSQEHMLIHRNVIDEQSCIFLKVIHDKIPDLLMTGQATDNIFCQFDGLCIK